MPSQSLRSNRLSREKSPYLLQHAHNPVDWYPWGDEAFQRAREERKFVFLSVGYSTCHWCHVMESESFEDVEVAALLNSVSIPVKVDREERPDIDQVYMSVCQALHGSGGWPLTVLLTPERVPFFAGTYFPKESRRGRMGLVDLVRRAGALWQEDPEGIRRSADEMMGRLRAAMGAHRTGRTVEKEAFASAAEHFLSQFDAARGGFGEAPKFPTPHNLVFLLRRYRRTGDDHLLRMVETTLGAMARGGLFDHLGGGFHRYSTDSDWLVPHFEKMLYDQAGLALAYLEAFQVSGDTQWADVARSTFGYVLRDLAAPSGGFYSAEDADSEGIEGKFYLWTRAEVLDVLGSEDGEFFCRTYGVRETGNFRDEASRKETGLNILHVPRPLDLVAGDLRYAPSDLEGRLAPMRLRLFRRREGRVRPQRDEKVLAGWNGLMIWALARGARVLDEPSYGQAASRAADFVLRELSPAGRLLRRWRDGDAGIDAFAEDYAFFAIGLLELYAGTFEPVRLAQAAELAEELFVHFRDEEHGGLFDTSSDAEPLVFRPREVYDGATPSANSVALEVFARLWLLTGENRWEIRARDVLDAWSAKVGSFPAAHTQWLQAAALLLEPTREVTVTGPTSADDTKTLLETLRRVYAPEATLCFKPAGADRRPGDSPPGAPVPGPAVAQICENRTCRSPVSDPAAAAAILATPPPIQSPRV